MTIVACATALAAGPAREAAAAYPIAGLAPQQRPVGAPVPTRAAPLSDTALTGIAPPLPASIARTAQGQGAWYTPFILPGMTHDYDLRGWHGASRGTEKQDYLRAVYSPLHFKPAIDRATDADCLACHKEVLDDRPRERAPAGVPAAQVKAWYQRLGSYEGAQDTFHRRHLATPLAKKLMNLQCTTCHQGHDPRDEAPGTSASNPPRATGEYTLRKQVNPETTCLRCHGQMSWPVMGLPGPWQEVKGMMQNNCLLCHANVRTDRHRVNFLNAEAIEKAGAKDGDICFGCHGGRAWYRIAFPYARHPWPGMPEAIPDWARNRPTETDARFLTVADDKNEKIQGH